MFTRMPKHVKLLDGYIPKYKTTVITYTRAHSQFSMLISR